MAGLSLGASGYGAAYAGGGIPVTGAMPVAAGQPTGTNISQMAYGIGSSQTSPGARTAGWGTVTTGVACAVLLAWIWHTLPR